MYTERSIASKHLHVSPELLRDIAQDDLHLLQLLDPQSFILHFVVLSEMFNILGMEQVLLSGIIAMELFEVVNLVLILNVTMVPGTEAQVGQPLTRSDTLQPIVLGDEPRVGRIKQCEYCAHSVLFLVFTDGCIGLIIQSVCLADFVVSPLPRGVVVMEDEERGGIKSFDVMFLCG